MSDCLGIPPTDVKLARTQKGKPYPVNQNGTLPGFNFNVSHQGEYAVLAVEALHTLGSM